MKKRLVEFAGGKYSQYGEDGISEKIFEKIGTTSRTCVEIGAWDGFHLSNTAAFWTKGWKAVLVEGDPEKFEILQRNASGHDCICVKSMVTPDGPDSIESILKQHGIAGEVDLLCIDIDGDDYFLFESLRELRPRVVICEYNPTIPAHLDIHAVRGNYFGCSVSALSRLAAAKGYKLAALTDTNAFFVVETDFGKLQEFETSLAEIRIDKYVNFLITSYAGDYLLAGHPVFGLQFPYRGAVHGDCRRVEFKPGLLRAVRPIKRFLHRFFR